MAKSEEEAVPLPPGIGEEGQRLKDQLERSERIFADTGRYYGIEELELKNADPIEYEKLFGRLRGGMVNARETALNISASPIVQEIGELCYGLYTAEGDSIVFSTGIMAHVHTMSVAIKTMIERDYEANPGIAPGDIFCNNDPVLGDVHNADVQTFVPIFWEDELIGWAAGVTHVIDIGATEPGSLPIGPTRRYEDGLIIPCLKIGAEDTMFADQEAARRAAVRTPVYWILDERTRLTGCHMIREAVLRVAEAIGPERYKRFTRELIEEGRISFLQRVRETLVPGRYRAPGFTDLPYRNFTRLRDEARVDSLMHAPFEMTVGANGTVSVSFDGANASGLHSQNCTPSALQGAIWVLLAQTVIPNDKVNDGAYLATTSEFPVGTWTNPDDPFVSTSRAWGFLIPGFTGMFRSLSRGFYGRGYLEEVVAGYPATASATSGGGLGDDGRESAYTNFEHSCQGTGAGAARDGADHCAAMWNPEGDMGEVESWEGTAPLVYLGRRVKPCTGGPGTWRGGMGYESLLMVDGRHTQYLQHSGDGYVFSAPGVLGGYPGNAGYIHDVHEVALTEDEDLQAAYPVHDGDPSRGQLDELPRGRHRRSDESLMMPMPFERGDVYLSVQRGGPGLGDPLARDPVRVAEDIAASRLSADRAETIYGVVAEEETGGGWRVDAAATQAARQSIRDERGRRARPVREWYADERRRLMDGGLIEPVAEMYRSSLALSARWGDEFKTFWDLPEDSQP